MATWIIQNIEMVAGFAMTVPGTRNTMEVTGCVIRQAGGTRMRPAGIHVQDGYGLMVHVITSVPMAIWHQIHMSMDAG